MRRKFEFLCFFILMLTLFNVDNGGEKRLEVRQKEVVEKPGFLNIPSLSLNSELCTLNRDFCLNDGAWLKYYDVESGNFLITGHNFFIYPLKAGVFFNLEDVLIGDSIFLSFSGNTYIYIVESLAIVEQDDVFVESFEGENNLLTMYTCYPRWGNSKRLVVKARRLAL